jgi:hypothetical protein
MSLNFNVRQRNGGTEGLSKTDRDPERKSNQHLYDRRISLVRATHGVRDLALMNE